MRTRFDIDRWREDMLTELGVKFQFAETAEERRSIWTQIRLLHKGRSADRVKQMETEKGLR